MRSQLEGGRADLLHSDHRMPDLSLAFHSSKPWQGIMQAGRARYDSHHFLFLSHTNIYKQTKLSPQVANYCSIY